VNGHTFFIKKIQKNKITDVSTKIDILKRTPKRVHNYYFGKTLSEMAA
jgi:hypothetical protein